MKLIHPVEGIAHYSIHELESMSELRECLDGGGCDALNWLFCSTSGVHGHYGTLDDALAELTREDADTPVTVTVLLLRPRMVTCLYGDLEVTVEDVAWLRMQVQATLVAIARAQEGNR